MIVLRPNTAAWDGMPLVHQGIAPPPPAPPPPAWPLRALRWLGRLVLRYLGTPR